MLLHVCCPVKDPLQFTQCMKFVQINKAYFLIIHLWSCWFCCIEAERRKWQKCFFFLLAYTVNPTHFYHNKKCFLCLLKMTLSFVCGLIFNSLNSSWFYQDEDYNWKKGIQCSTVPCTCCKPQQPWIIQCNSDCFAQFFTIFRGFPPPQDYFLHLYSLSDIF